MIEVVVSKFVAFIKDKKGMVFVILLMVILFIFQNLFLLTKTFTLNSQNSTALSDGDKVSKDNTVSGTGSGSEMIPPTKEIVIDVSGAVVSPGLYFVEDVEVVGQVIKKAGGLSEDASDYWVAKYLDLSRVLKVNQKVYIPYKWEIEDEKNRVLYSLIEERFSKTSGIQNTTQLQVEPANNVNIDTTASVQKDNSKTDNLADQEGLSNTDDGELGPESVENEDVDSTEIKDQDINSYTNINTASLEQLDSLSGIGPAYASRIVSKRPYTNFEDLAKRSQVPLSTLEKIKNLISF